MKIKHLGQADYDKTWQAMQDFTAQRTTATDDEIWCCEHPPVFTQGLYGKDEHILDPHGIPVVKTDRGGQVTYHGPGQLIVYFLIDLKRRKIGIRQLIGQIEQSVLDLLNDLGIQGHLIESAPGIYVDNQKICSLGLRVKRGCSYHGLALNVDMDLTPFSYINPCGFPDLAMTQIRDWNVDVDWQDVTQQLLMIILPHIQNQPANSC